MITLGDLFALFRTYNQVTGCGYSYLSLYDDLSGSLYTYDGIQILKFNTVPEACQMLSNLITKTTA